MDWQRRVAFYCLFSLSLKKKHVNIIWRQSGLEANQSTRDEGRLKTNKGGMNRTNLKRPQRHGYKMKKQDRRDLIKLVSVQNLRRAVAPPRVNTPLWPGCVCVWVCQCQGSSADIIRRCTIIQATDSPQGGPAEAEPPSLHLSAVAWHPAQGCSAGRSGDG